MRILVTGATGFVGSHIVKELSGRHEIIEVVRGITDKQHTAEVRVVPDISSPKDWSCILEDVEVVVHLAARVHVMKETADDPLAEFRKVNVLGTRILAEESARQGVKRLVFMSSVKVHGEGNSKQPYSAADTPLPVDPYGISKWEAEQVLRDVSRKTGLEVVILRPPVIYGPGVKGNIRRIAKLAETRLPLPLRSVNNRRSMISINNLTKWVERAACAAYVPQGPVLVSDPAPVSTKALVSEIGKGMGIKLWLLPVPTNLMRYVAVLLGKKSLAQRLFGDLEIVPSLDAYAGIEHELDDAAVELRDFGKSLRKPGRPVL